MPLFTVMGSHPGDGSVQEAGYPTEALAKHIHMDCKDEYTLQEIIDDLNKTGFETYEVKEITK